MFDVPEQLWTISWIFLLGGVVKGVTGMGLPTLSLALLTMTLGLHQAMPLIVLPSVITNIAQGFWGGYLKALLTRLWSLLLLGSMGVWLGVILLVEINPFWLTALLGILMILYGTVGLLTPQFPQPAQHEPWLTPTTGLITGLLTGLTGSAVTPAVLYFQLLQLPRPALVQAMGIWFGLSSLVLGAALGQVGLYTTHSALLSLWALIPAFTGMALGGWIRNRLSEKRFKQFFFLVLVAMGLQLTLRAVSP
ncbi:sulfite exporter TauE/SafE family protein [Magnetococcus sp. PR-3]|uniref:sulfite exporter TauE/SafE family protein n=1 Tax=Magnetococcus sp. PR-3 TaxID=3120355 RepID=UPI002FCE4F25